MVPSEVYRFGRELRVLLQLLQPKDLVKDQRAWISSLVVWFESRPLTSTREFRQIAFVNSLALIRISLNRVRTQAPDVPHDVPVRESPPGGSYGTLLRIEVPDFRRPAHGSRYGTPCVLAPASEDCEDRLGLSPLTIC